MSHGPFATLEALVAFDTVSDRPNLELMGYVEARLEACGAHTWRIGQEGEKTDLVARLGPDAPGGVMLAGHTDVVPVAEQTWHTDPFVLTERDGRLHGRGTADMKGALAQALDAVDELDPGELRKPLWLAFTYDEEVGCGGARRLAREMAAWEHRPSFALIGEPTEGRVVVAHKGLRIYRSHVIGRAAHASRPQQGASAILAASGLLEQIADNLPPERDDRFEPPGCTFNAGIIRGGEATNVVASRCDLEWELRPLPAVGEARLDALVEGLDEGLGELGEGVRVEHELVASVPAMASSANRAAADRVGAILGDTRRETRPYVTEGGLYAAAGVPAVICGPGRLDQAHQADESIAIGDLEAHAALLQGLIASLKGDT